MDPTAGFGQMPFEVTALFDDEDELNDVVEELQLVGFQHADISVSPTWKTVETKIGRQLETVTELADTPDAPHAVPFDRRSFGLAQGACIAGPLYFFSLGAIIAFAAGGADFGALTIAGVVAGASGAALGILPVVWLRRRHRLHVSELLDRGGLVLWLRVLDDRCEQRARKILSRYAARDMHRCPIAA